MKRLLVVVNGVTWPEYEKIKADMFEQLKSIGFEAIFACLPQPDYTSIEAQWLDDPDKESPIPIIFPPIKIER